MSRLVKITARILAFVIAAAAVMTLAACFSDNNAKTFRVYYTNTEGGMADEIVYKEWQIEEAEKMSADELTSVLLEKMFNTDLSDEKLFSVKPANVEINEYAVSDNIATFDFSEPYLEMSNVQEILLRASLVLTMIQEPCINGVSFTVSGQVLKDSNGKNIGIMNADNFADVLLGTEEMLKQETNLTIFFADETGTRLIPAKYHFTINNINTPMEEYIVQQLKTGPAIGSTYRTMAADVEIIKVSTSDNVCYVNFGSNFLEQEQPVSDEILIYSIVNSLCDLPYVNSVQFLINGTSDNVLHTQIDLSKPFTPNYELEIK